MVKTDRHDYLPTDKRIAMIPGVQHGKVDSGRKPAVAILLGWLGARMKHLSKYEDVYLNRNCATICKIASVPHIVLWNQKALRCIVVDVINTASNIIRSLEKIYEFETRVPLIIHVFSNGGCFVLEQMMLMLTEDVFEPQVKENLNLFRSRLVLGSLIFDSSPAYLHTSSGLLAIQFSVPNFFLRVMTQTAFFILVTVIHIIDLLACRLPRTKQYWDRMTYDTDHLGCEQIFVYSASDDLTDPNKLEELITTKVKRGLVPIKTKKFENSPHVLHLLFHKNEYLSLVNKVIDGAITRGSKINSLRPSL